jgi:methionine-rich copper-binding protein CopC
MRILAALSLLWLLLFGAAPAAAHAFLDRAEPRVGNAVRTAPREVTCWFTQNLEAAFSSLVVRDSAGAQVSVGRASVTGNTMRVALKPLPPGVYKVSWRVLSVDTHTTEGDFSFRVGE